MSTHVCPHCGDSCSCSMNDDICHCSCESMRDDKESDFREHDEPSGLCERGCLRLAAHRVCGESLCGWCAKNDYAVNIPAAPEPNMAECLTCGKLFDVSTQDGRDDLFEHTTECNDLIDKQEWIQNEEPDGG